MPIFYTIHNLPWGHDLTDGQRNCRTFLLGVCIYVGLYLILKNLHIFGYLGGMYDALYSSFLVILMADIGVMGYVYRSYFGRSILHELSPDEQKTQKWYYDPKTHTYLEHPPIEVQLTNELKEQAARAEYDLKMERLQEEITHLKQEKFSQEQTQQIIDGKNRLRAAVMIQRWWRRHLYQPRTGVVFKKAQQDFVDHIQG